jgi:hypothetical protein
MKGVLFLLYSTHASSAYTLVHAQNTLACAWSLQTMQFVVPKYLRFPDRMSCADALVPFASLSVSWLSNHQGKGQKCKYFWPLFLVGSLSLSPIVPGFLFLFLAPQPPRRYFFIVPDLPRRVGARDTTHRPPTRGGNRGGRSASPESDGASTTARRRGAKCSSS